MTQNLTQNLSQPTKLRLPITPSKLLFPYSQNTNLGDPAIVKPQVDRAQKDLERLKGTKYELEGMFQIVCNQLDNLTTQPNSSSNSVNNSSISSPNNSQIYESPPRKNDSSPKLGGWSNKGMTQSNNGSSSSLQFKSDNNSKNKYSGIAQGPAPPPPPPPAESIKR